MKFQLLQQIHAQRGRSNNFRASDSSADGSSVTKSPAAVFWIVFHCLCCVISLVLGFRFSRLMFFLLFSSFSTTNIYTKTFTAPFAADIAETLAFTTSPRIGSVSPPLVNKADAVTGSRVVVGRHGIRIRPWPHPNTEEVMKAHRIIQAVQREQKVQYGIKNPRTLIVITPTYVRTFQALHLTGLMHTLMNLPNEVVWIVVEAGGATNETAALLERSKSKLGIKHIPFEKKMPVFWNARHKLESEMRLHALRVVREEKLDGIVMFADDSNMHSLELFDEIQKVEWIGAVSVGILPYSSRSRNENDNKSPLPIQGPACNSSGQLTGWHTFNPDAYDQKIANYIGDMGLVLPRKLEWCVFVMNSRLVWEESEFRPEWIKDLDAVVAGAGAGAAAGADGVNEIETPLSFLEDPSMVEALGGCGKKVMVWWLRAEARADSKFPSGWMVEPRLEVTVPAQRTSWPDVPIELGSNAEKTVREAGRKSRTKRSRRSSRAKRKQEDSGVVLGRSSGETREN